MLRDIPSVQCKCYWPLRFSSRVVSHAVGATCSEFNWLYSRFSEVPHIRARFTWFERSQSAVGPRQWEAVFIVRDVGVWALFRCRVDMAGRCGLFLFCSTLWKKHILRL